jgi:hypothetical protein
LFWILIFDFVRIWVDGGPGCRQCIADDRLGFLQDAAQMIRSLEALRINLVMSSVPDGRAANHPLWADTFNPPMGAPLPGAWVRTGLDFFARQLGDLDLLRREFRQNSFCSGVAAPQRGHRQARRTRA